MSMNNGNADDAMRDIEGGSVVEIKGDAEQTTGSMIALQALLENQRRQGIDHAAWPSPLMQFTKARLRLADWRDMDEE